MFFRLQEIRFVVVNRLFVFISEFHNLFYSWRHTSLYSLWPAGIGV
jgi:hypothetical protein